MHSMQSIYVFSTTASNMASNHLYIAVLAFKQHAFTWTKSASCFTPRCANINRDSVFSCWVKVTNHHTWVSGADCADSPRYSPNLWRGLICHKVRREPSCLMEGEWGPTDKGSSVVVHPLHLHIAHLGSGSWRYRWRTSNYRIAMIAHSKRACEK